MRREILFVLTLITTFSSFASPQQRFKGKRITIAVFDGGVDGPISGPLYHFRAQWEKRTGAKLNIVRIPFDQLPAKIKTDLLRRERASFDGFIPCCDLYGDLIQGNFIEPIDRFLKDPRFPKWSIEDIGPPVRQLYQWGGKTYGVAYDCDAWILYCRKDLLTNPTYRKRFKAKYNYDLPTPPRTIQQLLDVAEFFNGWDFSGDGKPDYGISLPLKPHAQAVFFYLAFAAPFVVLPGEKVDEFHNVFFFNPRTMQPLINSPGHVRALESYVKICSFGPEAMKGWELQESWDMFLKGNAALTYSPGDVGSLAQDVKKSKVKGKLLCAPMPGSMEVYDRQKRKWLKLKKPNRVGNTLGCSWHGLISRFSKNKEVVYDFYAFLAERKRLFKITAWGWTGVDPGKIYDFPPEVSGGKGKGSLKAYLQAGYDKNDALTYLRAYWENYYEMDAWLEYLRIPGAVEFRSRLDDHLARALAGKETPKQALDRTAKEWQEILATRGKENLRRFYQESIGYGKPALRYN